MQDKSRNLLYYDANSNSSSNFSSKILENIRSAGWNVEVASVPEQALHKINEHQIRVGLAQIDGAENTKILHPVENMIRHTDQVEWIGLFPRICLENTAVKKMIGESLYDFHTSPLDPERLLTALGHAYGMASIKIDGRDDAIKLNGEDEMVGSSLQIQELFKNIRKVASVLAPLLITGESGTGKELAAVAIHERSRFSGGPFVAVNCGAIPATLVQSELFGYEKGAFTGAQQRKIGYIEAANGGTIFLDEIGDLPLEQQINLLRFLQEKTIQRIGGSASIHVDARVIAATHVDLERAVAEGRFREDLYYRLNVLQLRTPPLREREGDIELMAQYFFGKFSHERRKNVKGFSRAALSCMKSYSWPGNVRELINRIRRGMVMCEERLITPKDLGIECIEYANHSGAWMTLEEARENAERELLQEAFGKSRDNLSVMARNLGVSRVTLYRLLEKHGLRT